MVLQCPRLERRGKTRLCTAVVVLRLAFVATATGAVGATMCSDDNMKRIVVHTGL